MPDTQIHADDPVDVYLEKRPKTGLKGLRRIRKLLQLDIGILRLTELCYQLPALLLSEVGYGTGSRRCAEVNAEDDCLRIRRRGASSDTPGFT